MTQYEIRIVDDNPIICEAYPLYRELCERHVYTYVLDTNTGFRYCIDCANRLNLDYPKTQPKSGCECTG